MTQCTASETMPPERSRSDRSGCRLPDQIVDEPDDVDPLPDAGCVRS